MKLVLGGAVSERRSDFVVRDSPWGRTVLLAVFALIGIACCSAPLLVGGSGWFAWIFGLPCLLTTAFMSTGIVRAWREDWWLMIVRNEALIVRLRSQLNSDLPNDWANVVVIEREHIRGIRAERIAVFGDESEIGTAAPRAQLVIELDRPVPAEVLRAIEREANPGKRDRSHFFANIATVESPNELRVTWRGASVALTPSLRETLQALRRACFPVDEAIRSTRSNWSRLSSEEQDALVDSYAASGNRIDAIRLWRARHGGSLAEAKAEIERRGSRLSA